MIMQKIFNQNDGYGGYGWKQRVQQTKIKRINYKAILGMSLTKYILENKYKKNSDLLKEILLKIKENNHLVIGWDWRDITKNVRTSLSARRSEQVMYK